MSGERGAAPGWKSRYPMLNVEDAIDQVLAAVAEPGEVERIPLLNSLGRVLAEDVVSPLDIPQLPTSVMVRQHHTSSACRHVYSTAPRPLISTDSFVSGD